MTQFHAQSVYSVRSADTICDGIRADDAAIEYSTRIHQTELQMVPIDSTAANISWIDQSRCINKNAEQKWFCYKNYIFKY